jgi:hypothetical protein
VAKEKRNKPQAALKKSRAKRAEATLGPTKGPSRLTKTGTVKSLVMSQKGKTSLFDEQESYLNKMLGKLKNRRQESQRRVWVLAVSRKKTDNQM